MKLFIRFTLALTLMLVFSSVFLPFIYGVSFPRESGPIFDPGIRLVHQRYIQKNRPEIVLLGDSTLDDGIDPRLLSQQTGLPVYSIPIHGSASAMWYTILKNNISKAEPKPDYVVIVFRTSVLTAPAYRVQGKYFEALDEFAGTEETILLEKSFTNFMNPVELLAGRYLPLYALRLQIRRQIEAGIFYSAPTAWGCDQTCVDESLNSIFHGANLEPGVLADAVNTADSYLYAPEQLDFEKQLDGSYLPDMIQMAHDHEITLVFARIKVSYIDENPDPTLVNYLASLNAYFKRQNIAYLDYGNDPRLTPDLYSDSVHLNPQGEALFTQLLADDMKIIIQGK